MPQTGPLNSRPRSVPAEGPKKRFLAVTRMPRPRPRASSQRHKALRESRLMLSQLQRGSAAAGMPPPMAPTHHKERSVPLRSSRCALSLSQTQDSALKVPMKTGHRCIFKTVRKAVHQDAVKQSHVV